MTFQKYEWPLICLAHRTTDDTWHCLLFVKHTHYDDAYRFRLRYQKGFSRKGDAVRYAEAEFFMNIDRRAAHVVQLRLDQVFEWDGEGEPDPGVWRF